MAIKFFLVAILAVIALQGLEAKSSHVFVNENRNIIDDFNAAIEKLKEVIDEAVANGKETVDKLVQQVIEFAEKALEHAVEEVKVEVEKIMEQIKEVQELAQQAGLDISECIKAQQDAINALAQATVENLHACVDGKLTVIKECHDAAMKVYSEAFEALSNLRDEFAACSNVICKAGVVKKVRAQITSSAAQIRQILEVAINAAQTAIPEIIDCFKTEIGNMHAGINKIAQDIQQCINEKK